MKANSLLLIIDPQIDFISGSLPVAGASEAMDKLAEYVTAHGNDYTHIVATTDWHPYHHCSFKTEGGEWPIHCVQNSIGAAIHTELLRACNNVDARFTVLRKGTSISKEEYSIIQNGDSASKLDELIRQSDVTSVHVCGLAGNICVLNTLKDMMKFYGNEFLTVLPQFSPSLDDGTELRHYLLENNIKTMMV
ncbi:MAG: isochorismatase family protein [Prevotella sp.]|jgi:nicotinamidase/pyrazinamidase|nr:isochorismatase family protein [Prevotella sp.]